MICSKLCYMRIRWACNGKFKNPPNLQDHGGITNLDLVWSGKPTWCWCTRKTSLFKWRNGILCWCTQVNKGTYLSVSILPWLTSVFLMDDILEDNGSIFILHHPSTLSAAAEICLCLWISRYGISFCPLDLDTPCAHISSALRPPRNDRSSA